MLLLGGFTEGLTDELPTAETGESILTVNSSASWGYNWDLSRGHIVTLHSHRSTKVGNHVPMAYEPQIDP